MGIVDYVSGLGGDDRGEVVIGEVHLGGVLGGAGAYGDSVEAR